MARYIDTDKVMEEIASTGGHNLCEWSTLGVKALIDRQPTADVAPRAEVDELIYKLECLLHHATGGRLNKHTYDLITMEAVVTDYIDQAYCEGKDEGYAKAKSEVESIFDELIKAADEIAESYKKEADNMSCSDFARTEYRGTQIGALLVQYKIAELKKKYTKPEPPEGDES